MTNFLHRRFKFIQLTLSCLSLLCIPAQAHMLNMTNIDVSIDAKEQATIALRIDLGQSLMTASDYWAATQLQDSEQLAHLQPVLEKLNSELIFLIDEKPQPLALTAHEIQAISLDAIKNPLTPQMANLVYHLDLSSGGILKIRLADQLEVPWPLLIKVDIAGHSLPQSRLLTNVDRQSGEIIWSARTNQSDSLSIAELAHGWSLVAPGFTWVAVGFQHIIPNGLDHMLFILGLFFLAGNWQTLLLQITSFTFAHSLTLGMSMIGMISLPMNIVEPLIALSIVYIALDNLFATRLKKWRLVVVTIFGLIHGLGFASVLSNIGLPQDQFLLSLALFNLGVEVGQLTVITGAFLLVGCFRRQSWYQSNVAQPATIAIAGTGAYWFLKRITF